MRLLHTRDFTFKDFFDDQIPHYAILSHRWSDEEVSYDDFSRYRDEFLKHGSRGYGWTKIWKACELTNKYESASLDWVWIDTCRRQAASTNRAVLSYPKVQLKTRDGTVYQISADCRGTAINSMYRWYKDATVCLVFLPDVHNPALCSCMLSDHTVHTAELPSLSAQFYTEELMNSSWFTRAWTLQELLAPTSMFLFSTEFCSIGTKPELAGLIAEASNIPEKFIRGEPPSTACVAQRMKWAAKRQASRQEDIAYCLIGLFDVNLPLLYGEGAERAFRRLQKEIIQSSPDESIFCWSRPRTALWENEGMLAPTVRCFASDFDVRRIVSVRPHHEITNRGFRISVVIPEYLPKAPDLLNGQTRPDVNIFNKSRASNKFILPLNCKIQGTRGPRGRRFGLLIRIERYGVTGGVKVAIAQGCRTADLLLSDSARRPVLSSSGWDGDRLVDVWYSVMGERAEVKGIFVADTLEAVNSSMVSCQVYLDI